YLEDQLPGDGRSRGQRERLADRAEVQRRRQRPAGWRADGLGHPSPGTRYQLHVEQYGEDRFLLRLIGPAHIEGPQVSRDIKASVGLPFGLDGPGPADFHPDTGERRP